MVLEDVVEHEIGGENHHYARHEGEHGAGQRRAAPDALLPPAAAQHLEEIAEAHGQQHRHRHPSGRDEGQDEQQDRHPHQEQPPTRQALAVQHEDEADIDQGGARLALAQDGEHRQADDGGHPQEMPAVGQAESRFAHHRRQQQRGGDLGDLGRLELDRAQLEPRVRALDVAAHEDDQHQQEEHADVGIRREHFPEPGMDDEQDEQVQRERGQHPDELLAAARTPVEDGRRLRAVDGRIDVHPADQDEQQVAAHQPPVHGLSKSPVEGAGQSVSLSHIRRIGWSSYGPPGTAAPERSRR